MNTPVSFEIEKILIEKDIDMPVSPTIADVVMWLYKKYGLWIYIKQGYKWEWYIETIANRPELKYNDGLEESPTEAYEAGITYSLKNLI